MHDGEALASHHWNFEAGQREPDRAVVCIEGLLGGVLWVTLQGTLDITAHPGVTQELLDLLKLPVKALNLDLGGVNFIDSSGVGLLIVARTQAEFLGIDFTLEGVPPALRYAMDRAGLLSSFNLREAPHG